MQKTKKYCFTFLVEYKCDAWMFIRREHVFFFILFLLCAIVCASEHCNLQSQSQSPGEEGGRSGPGGLVERGCFSNECRTTLWAAFALVRILSKIVRGTEPLNITPMPPRLFVLLQSSSCVFVPPLKLYKQTVW